MTSPQQREGKRPAEFIADLFELKRSLLLPNTLNRDALPEPNPTYCILEMLIAQFFDKYKVDYREVELILRDRKNQI